ncbi:MAG TPA: hypothetical protein VFZ47_09085 [Chitinophagaceae bacterium]
MKTKVSVFLLLLSSAITLTSATYKGDVSKETSAQSTVQKVENVFRSFNLHRQQDGISINWVVSSNNVTGYIVQRSYDGEYFDDLDLPISNIGRRWSKATDNDVFPGYIHYRIIAILSDGTECTSPVQVIRIVRRK